MASNFTSEFFPKWFATEFYKLTKQKFAHNSPIIKWTHGEDRLRPDMFASASWGGSATAPAYIFQNREIILVFEPLHPYKSTVVYRRTMFSRFSGACLDTQEVYHGTTAGITRQYPEVFKVKYEKRVSSRILPRYRQPDIRLTVRLLSKLIQQSQFLRRTEDHLAKRIACKDYTQAAQICTWLAALDGNEAIENYLRLGYGEMTGSTKYLPTMGNIISASHRDRPMRHKIVLAGYAKFKKDFTNNVFGALVSKLND